MVVIGSLLFSQFTATYTQFAGGETEIDVSSVPTDLRVYTAEGTGGDAYGGVSVLLAELNGAKIESDFWGTGKVDKLVFKVGTKSGDNARLFIGDRELKLTPMDVITLRHFEGKYGVSNAGTTRAELHLDGTMHSAMFAESDLKHVSTNNKGSNRQSLDALADAKGALDGETTKIAFVIIDSQKVTGVELNPGGFARLQTERTIDGDTTKNIPVQWVKVDGETLDAYTYLDQPVRLIEFQTTMSAVSVDSPDPDTTGETTIIFDDNDFDLSIAYTNPISVSEFVGVITFFKVGPREARLSLDGYATDISPGPQGGNVTLLGGPHCVDENDPQTCVSFPPPTMLLQASPFFAVYTFTNITFTDLSTDDGVIVLSRFDFGDSHDNLEVDLDRNQPVTVVHHSHAGPEDLGIRVTHWYVDDGVYTVTLTDTDNTLLSNSTTLNITILNRAPVASFAFTPPFPVDLSPVQFSDTSTDMDGTIVTRFWDFGDGNTSAAQAPIHSFGDDGNYTVSLTVTDDDGAANTTSTSIYVGNQAPVAGFTRTPMVPFTGQTIQFNDTSTDADGVIVSLLWDFGDGNGSAASTPTHSYANSGNYTVSLTATDNDGYANTATANVQVLNQGPVSDFSWSPTVARRGDPVNFTQLASDPDGVIVSYLWNFGDTLPTSTDANPSHTFPGSGAYSVTLIVTDDDGATGSVTKVVGVNRPPSAQWTASSGNVFTFDTIYMNATGSDPDGVIVSWFWNFGDGSNSTVRNTTHAYVNPGVYLVTLTVTDDLGASASASASMTVRNRLPAASFTFGPTVPQIGEAVFFTDTSTDSDGSVVARVWAFSDTPNTQAGAVVNHSFASAGQFTVTLSVTDNSGGSSTTNTTIRVNTPPSADFSFNPSSPIAAQVVQFHSIAIDVDGSVVSLGWDFGDANGTASGADVNYSFAAIGTYSVTLTATDNDGGSTVMVHQVAVANGLPVADFTVATAVPVENVAVQFNDASSDPENLPLQYLWDFGDGSNSTDQDPSHSYSLSASYVVSLRVTDSAGATATISKTIRVYGGTNFDVELRLVHSPGDAPFNLTSSIYALAYVDISTGATLSTGASEIAVTADGWANASFAVGDWGANDMLEVRLTINPGGTFVVARYNMGLATRSVEVDPLRIALQKTYAIILDQDAEVGLVASTVGMAPVPPFESYDEGRSDSFKDPAKPITGNVSVVFIDGVAVEGEAMVFDVSYTGAVRTLPVLETGVPPLTARTDLKLDLVTDASGRAPFTVGFDVDTGAGAGVYLPGWHLISLNGWVVGSQFNPPTLPIRPQPGMNVVKAFHVSPEGAATTHYDMT
jgi:PKD repeat protein